jgi:lipoprotein-anchoring transpeptidase ErfK/SrfK
MNQTLLTIIVKIRGSILTIPTRFVDLLWHVTARTNWSFLDFASFHVAFRVHHFPYQSKSMQRIHLLSLALLSTVAASGTAVAGPLSLNPPQRQAPSASTYGAPPAQPAPQVRQPVAQAQYGGNFFEMLFRGPFGGRSQTSQDPSNYRQYPADLGPGMVESPYHPGQAVQDPRYMRQEVRYDGREAAGTIVINTNERMLYLVQGQGRAVRYGIGVGRPGFTWSGTHHITNKREWPDWTPPDEMLKRRPDLPRHMVGGPENPLGARAMYLGSTMYRIHGSNEPWTIGTQVSSGCIRMRNEDVIDLYGRVKVGTKVVVI